MFLFCFLNLFPRKELKPDISWLNHSSWQAPCNTLLILLTLSWCLCHCPAFYSHCVPWQLKAQQVAVGPSVQQVVLTRERLQSSEGPAGFPACCHASLLAHSLSPLHLLLLSPAGRKIEIKLKAYSYVLNRQKDVGHYTVLGLCPSRGKL